MLTHRETDALVTDPRAEVDSEVDCSFRVQVDCEVDLSVWENAAVGTPGSGCCLSKCRHCLGNRHSEQQDSDN